MSVLLLLIVFSFSHWTVCVTKLQKKYSLERMCSGTAVPTIPSHKVAIGGNQRYNVPQYPHYVQNMPARFKFKIFKYICIFSIVNIQLPCACEGK